MAPTAVIVGRVVNAPRLRVSPTGGHVVDLLVEEGDPSGAGRPARHHVRLEDPRLARNVNASLAIGDEVVVRGQLAMHTTPTGQAPRWVVLADLVAACLTTATAVITTTSPTTSGIAGARPQEGTTHRGQDQ